MTTYSVRCRDGYCRHRKVLPRHPDSYKRIPACPICKQRKGWRLEGREYNQRNLCTCSGPEAGQEHGKNFPHQRTHPLCDHHPQGPYNQAKARGLSDEDIPLDHLGKRMKQNDPVPF